MSAMVLYEGVRHDTAFFALHRHARFVPPRHVFLNSIVRVLHTTSLLSLLPCLQNLYGIIRAHTMTKQVAGQLKTNLRRKTRACSDSDILTSSKSSSASAAAAAVAGAAAGAAAATAALDDDCGRSRGVSDAALASSSALGNESNIMYGGSHVADRRRDSR